MSTFDIRPDAPGLLRAEAINVAIQFTRTGPTTARISWNIPAPAPGCGSDNQAYCGILVTLDTVAASASTVPQRGTVYNSDATGDTNLFAGDKIGTSMVVGAFYEDRTTTYFDISGLKPNTPYYVSGYPMDCQHRYFAPGVHAYSLDYTNRGTDGTHGSQVVVLNAAGQTMGVDPAAYTGLVAGSDYDFQIQLGMDPKLLRPLDPVDCKLAAPTYTITIQGEDAQTYTELVAAINKQLSLLRNAAQGPDAPGTGSYYFNISQKKLFQWDGSEHVEIPVIVSSAQPNAVSTSTYWLNTATGVVGLWNGSTWDVVTVIANNTDPATPVSDLSYWFDSTRMHEWNGVTWCDLSTIKQATDPSLGTDPTPGSFWYNESSFILYRWNNAVGLWTTTVAIQSDTDPNTPTAGSFWFDNSSNTLYTYNSGWTAQSNVAIAEVAPSTPGPGKLWYKPTTFQLFQRDVTNTSWVEQDVFVFHADPTQRSSCDLWWELDTDVLRVWDKENSAWVAAPQFYIQSADPAAAPVLSDGTIWYNTTTNQAYAWENSCFTLVQFTAYATDPRSTIADGVVWHNTSNDTWQVRASGVWSAVTPVKTALDPSALPTGSFWFNTSNSGLKLWNGSAWSSVTYSSAPLAPQNGTRWFDTNSSTLKMWNGMMWVTATPLATVELDCNYNLLFTDTTVGGESLVRLSDGTLFQSLEIGVALHNPNQGSDGASDRPSYAELGIGTDGSDAPRNAMVNELRMELGYPVVDVELTKDQMDYAINRALSEFRSHSSIAYKRGFVFMSLRANEQRYFLTSKRDDHNRIVDIIGVYRLTSSFLSSAHGAGVYGQIVLQNMYNMGSFDVLSYHIMSEYTKLLEMMFAGRITYTWNEQTRELFLHHRFSMGEQMVSLEVTQERTEQDLLTDRYTKSWIRRYAGAMCRLMLAEVRGKFSTLPGAGGSVTLNANDLRAAAKEEIDNCMQEIADYVADRPEEYGMGTQFLFG